jgi:intracellular sulfur oxidation DsrE/DsrF family protein
MSRLPERWLGLALLATLLSPPGMADQPSRVVYHINFDDPGHQISALHNLENQYNAAEGNIELLVVLHGAGLSLLLYPEALDHATEMPNANGDQEMLARIDQLRDLGVRFLVAANSARRHHIDPLIDLHGVEARDLVPSALLELTRLQQQGYIYIKP